MKLLNLFLLFFLPFFVQAQETKMHTSQLMQSGATDQQFLQYDSATDEWIPANAPSGADNWGSQVVVSDASLTGTGVTGDVLSVDETQLATSFATDAELAASDEADGDKDDTNELQNLSLSGQTLEISNGTNADLSSFATDAELTDAILAITYYDKYTEEIFSNLTSGSTVTISSAPVNSNYQAWTITRGGLKQRIGSATADVSVTGTTITFNQRDFEDGETVIVQRPNK